LASNNKKRRTKDDAEEPDLRPRVPAYKYSKRGRGILHEAIILGYERCFVAWHKHSDTDSVYITPEIEEATRVIVPPNAEEYPYTPI
jgi:hypothetical protein